MATGLINGHNASSDEDDVGEEDDTALMTLDEIINGKGDHFPGLMGMVNAYLNSLNVDVGTKCELRRYLDLIKWRAKGEYMVCVLEVRCPDTQQGD